MHKLKGGFNLNSKYKPDVWQLVLHLGVPFWVITREFGRHLLEWVEQTQNLEAILYRVMYHEDVWHPQNDPTDSTFSLTGWMKEAQEKDGQDIFADIREIEKRGVKVYIAGPNEYAPRLPDGQVDWDLYKQFIDWERERVKRLRDVGIRSGFGQFPVGWLTDEIWEACGPVREEAYTDDLRGAAVEHQYGGFGTMGMWLGENQGDDIFNAFGNPPTPFPVNLNRSLEAYLVGRSVPIIGPDEDTILAEIGLDKVYVPDDFYPYEVLAQGKDLSGWRDHGVVWKNAKKEGLYTFAGNSKAEYLKQLKWFFEQFSGFSNYKYAAVFGIGPGWYEDDISEAPFTSHDVTAIVPELIEFWQSEYGREPVDSPPDPEPQPDPAPDPAPQIDVAYREAQLAKEEMEAAGLQLQIDGLMIQLQAKLTFIEFLKESIKEDSA